MITSPLSSSSPALRLAPRPVAADPVLALYQQYIALVNAQKPISARARELRAGLVERHGEPRLNWSVRSQWDADPACDELQRVNDECDEFTTQITDVIRNVIDTPPTILAGVLAKLRIGNDMLGHTRRGSCDGIMEDIVRAAMADAQRVLEDVR
jgi:hypothetical protein